MLNKEYVTLETAKLLKEKKFIAWCDWVYEEQGETHRTVDAEFTGFSNPNLKSNQYAAPLQAQAQKWLREAHCIDVLVNIAVDFDCECCEEAFEGYSVWIVNHTDVICKYADSPDMHFALYEDALEAGLKYALNSI